MLKANKALGQHFLQNTYILQKIANLIPSNYQNYIEIGPGTGNLTKFLTCRPITCIEFDPRFNVIPDVTWIHGDAVRYKYSQNDYVIGNIPYNISGPLFKELCRYQVQGWVLLVQKEVAERVVAKSGKAYGRLSVLMQSYFDVKYHFDVAPEMFNPAPKVWSAVISGSIKKDAKINLEKLDYICFEIFKHQRKQIRTGLNHEILQKLLDLGVPPTARPGDISISIILKLADIIQI